MFIINKIYNNNGKFEETRKTSWVDQQKEQFNEGCSVE